LVTPFSFSKMYADICLMAILFFSNFNDSSLDLGSWLVLC
jgi:hypothetical protein